MFYTLATAGHIDHGKSTLVRALTGINPDRLPEEQKREMTIDLGFAWFSLENGDEVGIVDVPGHERFIRNMIAGVGGIDYVLFIVAADDGWMPQSQEHLEILDFLGHKHGAVVVTKTDLVQADWIELVKEDIAGRVRGTFLENAPIFEFSAQGNRGLEDVYSHLNNVLAKLPERYDPEKPRLFIDRVFSLTGIGTVVTGTMRDGSLASGEDLEIIPSHEPARIKSIQTFKQQRQTAYQGARTALSLTGISKEQISRGNCLVRPKAWDGTHDLALRLKLSDMCRIPLTHNRKVTVLLGTTESDSTARMFRDVKLGPGEEGVCLLSFDRKVMARLGDKIILRYPAPDMLVGGGTVTDVDLQDFIRKDKKMMQFYLERDVTDIQSLIMSELRKYKLRKTDNLLEASNFKQTDIDKAVAELIDEGEIEKFEGYYIGADYKKQLFERILEQVETYHKRYPNKTGISKSELASRLKLEISTVDFALDKLTSDNKLKSEENIIALPGHETRLKPEHEKIRKDILEKLSVLDLKTPTRREIERKMHINREVLNYLVQTGEVIEPGDGILFRREDFEKIRGMIEKHIRKHGSVEVKDVKEMTGLTRKYTIPILEHLDRQGITKREGDRRILAGS